MPPATSNTIGDLAVALAASQISRFSESVQPTLTSTDTVLSTFHRDMPQMSRNALIANGITSKVFLGVGADAAPAIINHAVWTVDATNYTPIVEFNNGDAFDDVIPAHTSPASFNEYFISLVPRIDAMTYHLKMSAFDVLSAEGPGSDEDANPQRFGWTSVEPQQQPRLVALPTVLPLPPGAVIPENPTWDNITAANANFPIIGIWIRAYVYLKDKHNGTSISADDHLITFDQVPTEDFAGFLLAVEIPLSTVWYTRLQSPYQYIKARAKLEQRRAVLAYADGELAPVSPTTGGAGPALMTQMSNNMNTMATTLSNINTAPTLTKSDRNVLKDAKIATIKLQLLFAYVVDTIDPNTSVVTQEVVLPKLSASGLALLEETKTARAVTNFQEGLESYLATIKRSEDRLESLVGLCPSQFDAFFLSLIRNCRFQTKPLVTDPCGIKDKVSLIHFTSARQHSATYREWRENGNHAITQEFADEEISKRAAKSTELYKYGICESTSDIAVTIANLMAVASFIFKDKMTGSTQPEVFKSLLNYESVLRSSEGEAWGNLYRNEDHLPHCLLMEAQSIFAIYVAIATNMEYRLEAEGKKPLNVKIYTTAALQAEQLAIKLSNLCPMMTMGEYSTVPATFALVKVPTKPRQSTVKQTSDRSGHPVTPDTVKQSGKKRGRDDDTPVDNSKQGIFRYNGPSTVRQWPIPDALFRKGNQQVKLCRNFCFKDKNCKHGVEGKDCHYFHIAKRSSLKASDETKINNWIVGTPTVRWNDQPAPESAAIYQQDCRLRYTATSQVSMLRTQIPAAAAVRSEPHPLEPHRITDDTAVDMVPAKDTEPGLTPLQRHLQALKPGSCIVTEAEELAVLSAAEEREPSTTSGATCDLPIDVGDANRLKIPTKMHKAFKEKFVREQLPTKVQAQLNQPFGKDNLVQCFKSAATYDHIILPVLKSGFVSRAARRNWESASKQTAIMTMLLKRHKDVDFRPLRGYNLDEKWDDRTDVDENRVAMTTACALHYDLDIPSVVRWIGGPHVGAHRDHGQILARLKPIIDTEIYNDLVRIFTDGAPAKCNASASAENFQAYRKYGNHKSVTKYKEAAEKAGQKESRRDFSLTMDATLIDFIPNAHLTPAGIANGDGKARLVSDSGFRPDIWCFALNDWTDKRNEPALVFPGSFLKHLNFLFNLRISFPLLEIYNGDDDVSCAFKWIKYHCNLVAAHAYLVDQYLRMSTGQSFGDTTSPANWEPIPRARQQYAQHLWDQEDIVDVARREYDLPEISFAPPPTQEEIANFARMDADELNPGVFNNDGTRKPPGYHHHVDDNMYCDVKDTMENTLAASVVALYRILGKPDGRIADPLARAKLTKEYSHLRLLVGWDINTRTMTLILPDEKRANLVQLLRTWVTRRTYQLLEAAELHGLLNQAGQANRKGRAMFFVFQNALRADIKSRYHQVKGYYDRNKRTEHLKSKLPANLHQRTDQLVAREMANLLWRNRTNFTLHDRVRSELQLYLDALERTDKPWSISIAHIVPRNEHFVQIGDASHLGGGANCHFLQVWFTALWSDKLRAAIKLPSTHPRFVHINALEFLVCLLELASTLVILEDTEHMRKIFPNGVPKYLVLLMRSDNKASVNWCNIVSSKSVRGQMFVHIYAELLERTDMAVNCLYLEGEKNILADDTSRPPTHLSAAQFHEQLCHKHSFLRSYRNYRPSPEFVALLQSRLYTAEWLAPPTLPKSLGSTVPGSSISSFSCTL